jgi:ATP-dependent Clp protease ATP-binding subunit ClpB
VFNVLLQVLDDGRLTDGQGRTVDFRNTVLIMTSNVGSDGILGTDDPEQVRGHVEAALRSTFRPEFLNRIDETVIFHRLGREELRQIVDLQLQRVVARLAARRISLEVTDAARDAIAEAGYDPAFGARPLKRAIQRTVENPLALRMLEGGARDGDTIVVEAGDQGLDVRIVHAEAAAV